ncbi:methyltransferase [Gracilibacillus halophilus YIM-C55.5]|uniref:Methyltransferase n=1 Tax=Gracilibacillus halophilus YIM-C55.5 TaxID=1308866 RepID=N4WC87_9BACI|nr:class I SAM-dependent methyltransferase [Gracilibacillus halophilus]ENH97898.1 methyltransferase [Gracilibacillus halophilus YIM-C55.5]
MIEDTGERIIPENMNITNELLIEHLTRYHFSVPFVQGRVLDFAAGAGYGTHIIAKKCKKHIEEIIGVDIDPDVVKYAQKQYYHPLSSYQIADVTDNDLSDQLGRFDTILSFETIEHVEAENQFLENVYQLLKPGGTLILSTPFGAGRGKPCGSPFHVHQVTEGEFFEMFQNFSSKTFYYQKGALIEPAANATQSHYPLGIVIARK